MNVRKAARRFGDAGENLEQRAFASSVSSNDANNLALLDLEGHVFEGPESIGMRRDRGRMAVAVKHRFQAIHDLVTQGIVTGSGRDRILLREVLDANGDVAHNENCEFRIANFEGAKLNLAIPNSTFKVGGLRPFCRFADAGENGQKFARFLK